MKMTNTAICLVATLGGIVSAQERAHVIVMKDLSDVNLVENLEFNVTYSVHNVGDTTAENIEIVDSWPDDTFELVAGEIGCTFDKVLPGASKDHWFTLKPIEAGFFVSRPASVEYSWQEYDEENDAEETESAVSKSSPIGKLEIVSAAQHLRATSQYLEEWTVFFFFSFLAITLPFFVWQNKKSEFHSSGKRK